MRHWVFFALVVAIGAALWGACSGTTSLKPATVNVTISDPSTCSSAQGGMFSHVFVTITDVTAQTGGGTVFGSGGEIDLTPNLRASGPVQIDLLGASSNCLLGTLGSNPQMQSGTFEQLRVMLAGNDHAPASNACGTAANCAVLSDGTVVPLLLSSQMQTGLKIPSGQIAGGKFVVAQGQTIEINIDFNACASIVSEGNGQLRLKPVLHAGEISQTHSIAGTVVDSSTQQPIPGKVIVAAEQPDANGIGRVVLETAADGFGKFTLCPLAAGSYDLVIVAAAVTPAGLTGFGATVIPAVPVGTTLTSLTLVAQTSPNTAPATILGQVTTDAPRVEINASALQQITSGSTTRLVTLPVAEMAGAIFNFATVSSHGCPAGLACGGFALVVPAANARVGTLSNGVVTFSTPAAAPADFVIDVAATANGNAACSSPGGDQQITTTASGTPLTVSSGQTVTAKPAAFTGCTAL